MVFRDVLIGYGAIALLYLPWVPTLLYQAAHTGRAVVERAVAARPAEGARRRPRRHRAGGRAAARRRQRAARLLGAARRPSARTQQAAAARIIGLTILGGLALAFVASQISPGWTLRYFAALIGPLILLAGGVALAGRQPRPGDRRAARRPVAAPADGRASTTRATSTTSQCCCRAASAPGDIVVSTHPEQVPVEAFYFPAGLRWASGMGWWPDTGIMDWRDALDRYRAARVKRTANTFIRALKPGQQLVLVQPILRTATWNAPWTRLVRRRSKQWERVLGRDRRLSREARGAAPEHAAGCPTACGWCSQRRPLAVGTARVRNR